MGNWLPGDIAAAGGLKQDNNTSVEKIRFFASNIYDTISRDKI